MRLWSYTIMGNEETWKYDDIYSGICVDYQKDGEYKWLDKLPRGLSWRILVDRAFDEIVDFVIKERSRMAYQALGVFLMSCGAKIPKRLRNLILAQSLWEQEKDQLFNVCDRRERYFYLSHFRYTLNNYKEGVCTYIFKDTPDDIGQDLRNRGFEPIDYPFLGLPNRPPIRSKIGKIRNDPRKMKRIKEHGKKRKVQAKRRRTYFRMLEEDYDIL